MSTPSKLVKSLLAPAAPYLALFALGTVLASLLGSPFPGPAVGIFHAVVALRIGVMLSAARGAPGEREADARPSRRGPLHAAHV